MMFKNTDKDLWASFINGDDNALKLLYEQFVDLLYAFGLRFTDDTDMVKDGIQDLFVDLYKYRKKLATEVNVKSYLFTSLKRKICLVLKKNAATVKHSFELPFLLSPSIEEQITNDEYEAELLQKLNTELALLPARQKEALYLRYNSELEYEQISEIMDVSLATCRTLVYRGVKQLKEQMLANYAYKILA
ncbi:RNA polymerase sigma factor [Pedobacter hiemivivus]|uniref:RNA polymerase sigma factor n=1 Tax=Pedobacter hiemivivus TaxID=2530454 RepID=A0A4R0MN17_9SPHI|nr:RNA polymerase sigma factor [Pedobacter hiemivivus]TCC87887.1 RNA polymerase sigma factor [Pedobacter hiemivivus]TKC62168.1 RNA polymerase sigma factor [Pedobacter hiemivivus]